MIIQKLEAFTERLHNLFPDGFDRETVALHQDLTRAAEYFDTLIAGKHSFSVDPELAEIWQSWKEHCSLNSFIFNRVNERVSYNMIMKKVGGDIEMFQSVLEHAMSRNYTQIYISLFEEICKKPENKGIDPLFANSEYKDWVWFCARAKQMLLGTEFEKANLPKYYTGLQIWSATQKAVSHDWLLTLRFFLERDKKKNQLEIWETESSFKAHCIDLGTRILHRIAQKCTESLKTKMLEKKASYDGRIFTFLEISSGEREYLEDDINIIQFSLPLKKMNPVIEIEYSILAFVQ